MPAMVVVLTAGSEEQANLLAEELVHRRHASCVNIVPGIRSIYRWEGKICREGEWMLLAKTTDSQYAAIEATVRELHSYDLPEILAFTVELGEKNYLRWNEESVGKTAASEDEDGSPKPLDGPND